MVRDVTPRAGDSDAKETFLIDAFRSDWIIRFSIEHDLDRARVRAKDPDLHTITDLMRA